MDSPTPVVVLASTDPTVRETAIATALLDRPHLVVVVHDLTGDRGPAPDTDPGDTGPAVTLTRRVLDWTGAREQTEVPLEHACAGCALREDAVPAIAALLADGAGAVLLALPLGAEILPATRQLAHETEPGGRLFGAELAHTVAAVSPGSMRSDLVDDGDVVAHLVTADLVVLAGHDDAGRDLVDALRSPTSTLVADLCEPWLALALAGEHDLEDAEERCDPVTSGPGHGFRHVDEADGVRIAASGVWQIELTSERPFHPERLLALAAELAPEETTSRGVFWLPNRPDTACGWEATGGGVLIGVAGPWEENEPQTRLVVVGHGGAGRAPWRNIRRAFLRALATTRELAEAAAWLGRPDPLARFLGDPADLYRTSPPAA